MQLPTSELAVSEAIEKGRKISSATVDELNQMFRTIFMLVGLRPQFMPNELESIFLCQFISENYAGHTMEEVVLAFKMVAKGEAVDDDGKIIELYDYFTPAYFGKVMKAYRSIASHIGNKLADKTYIEKLKELDNGKQGEVTDWREVIETDYQFYIADIDTSTTYPEQHYNTLVEDGLIKENFWTKKFKSAKLGILQELNRGLAAAQLENKSNNDRIWKIQNLLSEYTSGKRDAELELTAKQRVIAAFFKYNKELGNKSIYLKK